MKRKKDALDALEHALKEFPAYKQALLLKADIGRETGRLEVEYDARYVRRNGRGRLRSR
jgi:hypothetical protein